MVSIVLPTYNGEQYIRESIDSIIAQTYKNWELIIVDDCSIDNTPSILEKYVNYDSRIRVIHNSTNRKLPESLNIGFRNARGRYYTWISDDNSFEDKAIELMRGYLEQNHNCMMVVGNTIFYGENDCTINRFDMEGMYLENTVGGCFMYREQVLREIGEYDPDKFLVEDYDYWLRIYDRYGYIGSLDMDLFKFRRHNKSLTSTRGREIAYQKNLLRKKYLNKILKNNNDESIIAAMLSGLVRFGLVTTNIKNQISELFPELGGIVEFKESKPTYVFGAGYKGKKVSELISKDILSFLDTDTEKIGKTYCGKKVISIKDCKVTGNEQILIAVGEDKLSDSISRLWDSGIRAYCIMSDFEKKMVNGRSL